ncbi:hypothetical protein, partial [Flavobacterium facile]|uniref:hypothetical protein n=1 Tax=Flavobacterium facile TaxID=2893174 RepID=UPI002E77071A
MHNENHLEAIHKRLETLLLVLQYDSQKTNYFSPLERMQINQERASKFDYINYLFKKIEHSEVRIFSVS